MFNPHINHINYPSKPLGHFIILEYIHFNFLPLFIYQAYYHFKVTTLIFNQCLHFQSCLFIALTFLIIYSLLRHLFLRKFYHFPHYFIHQNTLPISLSLWILNQNSFLWRSSPPLYIIIYLLFLIVVFITHWDHITFNLMFTWEFTHPHI